MIVLRTYEPPLHPLPHPQLLPRKVLHPYNGFPYHFTRIAVQKAHIPLKPPPCLAHTAFQIATLCHLTPSLDHYARSYPTSVSLPLGTCLPFPMAHRAGISPTFQAVHKAHTSMPRQNASSPATTQSPSPLPCL